MSSIRIKKFQQYLKKENLDGFILNKRSELIHGHDVRYFSGFTGDTGKLVIMQNKAFLIVDGRFHNQAPLETKGAKVIPAKSMPVLEFKDMPELQKKNIKIGYDPDYLTCAELKSIKENLSNAILVECPFSTRPFTMIKEKAEIENIQKAIDISETALERIFGFMKPGMRESEIAAELEYQMKMLGATQPAFDTIVASGWRASLPHGVASTKKIEKGDFVTIDFGALYNGYVSDITRTVVMGKATARQKRIYDVVLKANIAGIKKIKSGVSGVDVDKAARKVVEKARFGKYFNHGTGHGIGVYVHVGPSLGSKSKDILKPGMVVTVEPGIYIEKFGGVRIEDDVLVTKTGSKVLTSAPKKLLEL